MSKNSTLSQRESVFSDASLLYQWTNDPDTRKASFHPRQISWQEHQRWLSQTLKDPLIHLYIVSQHSRPVGTYRLHIKDNRALVSVSVAPDSRHQGLGTLLLRLLVKTAGSLGIKTLIAQVRTDNPASRRLFEKCGFKAVDKGVKNSLTFFQFELEVEPHRLKPVTPPSLRRAEPAEANPTPLLRSFEGLPASIHLRSNLRFAEGFGKTRDHSVLRRRVKSR